MPRIIKIGPVDINPDKLIEEVRTAGFADTVIPAINRPGYDQASPRRWTAAAARRVVTTITTSSGTTVIEADPRELWVEATRNLTAGENTTLDNLLAAHVHTVLTAEQQRQDTDEADLVSMLSLLAGLGTDANPNGTWASLNATNKTLRLAFTLRKVVRYIARKERGEPV